MAERRMFYKNLITSDKFLNLSHRAQCLYFFLMANADDDGFVDCILSAMRISAANAEDLESLIKSGFVIPFGDELLVITHWIMQNKIRSDRYRPTVYSKEFASLRTDSAGVYHFGIPTVSSGKESVGKVRRGKESKKKESKEKEASSSPSPSPNNCGEYKNVVLSESEMKKLQEEFPTDLSERIDRLSSYLATSGKKYKSHFAIIRKWAKEDEAAKNDKALSADKAGKLCNYTDTNEIDYKAYEDMVIRSLLE